MADKKEVFDYLRNKQKAAEIEAKVNGINLWVLLGAIAVVTWQLFGSVGTDMWGRPELIVPVLLCAEACHMLSWFVGGARHTRGDVRYSQWTYAEMESPFLMLLLGTLLLLPPIFSLAFFGKSWGAAVLCLFGLTLVGMSITAIGSRLLNLEMNTEKFPKPDFVLTTRADTLNSVCLGIAFSLAILEQGMFAWEHRGAMSAELAKQLILLAVLYLLLLVTVLRKLHCNRIAWTYELETELLLGVVSTEVAARRIEHRGLGPRLQDVMDRFFDDMDLRISELDSLFDQCRSKLESVKEVPPEYSAERASRIREATLDVCAHIGALSSDCTEFGSYLKRLAEKSVVTWKAILAPHVACLNAKHEIYEERLDSAKAKLKMLAA
jgi:hypothetical protein